ncbi:MAG: TrmH family RNA methyltransferase [Bdellovibrionales bacterium]
MVDDLDFSRSQLTWSDRIQVGNQMASVEQILSTLPRHMTEERIRRLREVVAQRSLHMVPVLENIYDRGNVSAVMRSCEAFGFLRMYLVDAPGARFKAANRVTRGAEKWLDVKRFGSPCAAAEDLKRLGYQICVTDLEATASIGDLDWSRPTAVVLGNEKDGVSPEMKALSDRGFRIPMLGFSQSFNISVAAALIFYHARLEIRALGDRADLTPSQQSQVLANYILRGFDNPESLLRAHSLHSL